MPQILHKLTIETPAKVVYNVLKNPENCKDWYMPAEKTADDAFKMVMDQTAQTFKILKNSQEEVVWQETSSEGWEPLKTWSNSKISFALQEKALERLDGKICTVMRFSHTGISGDEDNDFFRECNYYWAHFLTKLKKLCEDM